jgi:hypothetical protein
LPQPVTQHRSAFGGWKQNKNRIKKRFLKDKITRNVPVIYMAGDVLSLILMRANPFPVLTPSNGTSNGFAPTKIINKAPYKTTGTLVILISRSFDAAV